ncbi:MAG TPA: hypothetical protein VFU22_17130 [Roseiflexaceae bacterium]|nr:hypothetical protein [Roseiflexaceae bacterium]
MSEIDNLQAFQLAVRDEIRMLQDRLPEWRRGEPYADHLRQLEPLERREAERLDRLLRHERTAAGERNRDRMFRERRRPWSEDERWTLRKRVWRERRDRERELLAQREQALLEREQELTRLNERLDRWLSQIRQLEPDADDWCDEQSRLREDQGITPELLDQSHQRRRQAAERRARELLARADVRAALGPALHMASRDPITIAQAVAPPLSAMGALEPPIVIAALALLVVRNKSDDAGA